jgi:hypothetical protein
MHGPMVGDGCSPFAGMLSLYLGRLDAAAPDVLPGFGCGHAGHYSGLCVG